MSALNLHCGPDERDLCIATTSRGECARFRGSKQAGNRNEMSTEKVAKDLAKQLRNVGPKLAAKLVEARIDSPENSRYKPIGDLQFELTQFPYK